PGEVEVRDALRRARGGGDRVQVAGERLAGVFVGQRPRALEAGGAGVIRHYVVTEAGDGQEGRHRDSGTDATCCGSRRLPIARCSTAVMEPRPYEQCSVGNTSSRAAAQRAPWRRTARAADARAAAR